ncbi:MAG: flavodoxin family protein [Candidatus Pacebacteria bacterium]|nr:flavodoxin family protein [Candidatus Paceibacterota bacterium]
MKSLIIYYSSHHNSTQKIAETIASELHADLVKISELKNLDVSSYDLIGFGSGIYMTNFNGSILSVIDKLIGLEGKKTFIFSTSGMGKSFINNFDKGIRDRIKRRGGVLIGDFSCLGLDTYGPVGWLGGFNRNRPDANDIKNAISFARNLLQGSN